MRRPLSGLSAWLVQRLSAVFMLGFIVFVLLHFLIDPPRSYQAWHSWVGHPGVGVAAAVFVAALLTHAWVGLRDVTLDYVAPPAARTSALALIVVALFAAGAWALELLLPGRG